MTRAWPTTANQRLIRRFVNDGLGAAHDDDTLAKAAALGFADKYGELVAGFLYHDYSPEDRRIEISGYSSGRDWVCREWPEHVMHYPFEQLDCAVVYGRHSEWNKRVRRIWKAFGAVETRVPDLWRLGEAAVFSVLTADAWARSKLRRPADG